jgi:SAM-dependent methyltransferase
VDIHAISSGLQLSDDGIWYSSESQAISYPADGHDCCFAIEEASFWFRHRNSCIVAALSAFPPPNQDTIFDIGGGNGFVSLGLSNAGFDVALVEPGRVGAANAKRRGIRTVICATTEAARFTQRSLSAIGLFDVIEHIEGDISFLQSIRALMKPGGLLYATVPAFPWLWSEEDVQAGHFRRYTLREVSDRFQVAGFELLFSSYFFRPLPIPIFLLRTLPYKLGLFKKRGTSKTVSRDHAVRTGLLSRIVNAALKPEVDNLRGKRVMSFGGSCLVVAGCP